ncbi:hypothetical protein R1sor_000255 [Riccia sorocarpa]|uniref:Terpenoid synthase n=1 Tax=Riccia sorocarpa TaxID=122646 RepID=A0ABD3GSL9_9MARC
MGETMDSHLQDAGHTATTGMVSTEGSPVPANVEVTKQPIELLAKEVKAFLHSLNYDDDTMRTAYEKYETPDEYLEPALNRILDDEVNAGRLSHEERVATFNAPSSIGDLVTYLITLISPMYSGCSESNYGPVGLAIIVQGTIDYFVGCILESWNLREMACPATSRRFPAYMRGKTCAGAAYAHFLFPEKVFPEAKCLEIYLPAIPDIASFIGGANDILSYYKESIDEGDKNTYLKTMSRIVGCNAADLWRSTCESQKALIPEITATLSRREDLRQAWLNFRDGYILWHLVEKERYRLHEIGIQFPWE